MRSIHKIVMLITLTLWHTKVLANDISLMTFNVENLFDTKHDIGKGDYAYLPLSEKNTSEVQAFCAQIDVPHFKKECLELDWNENVVRAKLQKVAGVITQVNFGLGADIVVLPEVENIGILRRLVNAYLPDSHYKPILIEGPDERGIDVGMLTRLPIVGNPVLHSIEFQPESQADAYAMGSTRGILQVNVRLPNHQIATVFALHFPSGFHPYYFREQAGQFLNELLAKQPKDRLVIAAGDFNINSKEDKKNQFYEKLIGEKWRVGSLLDCAGFLGTEYYKKTWSFLDNILFANIYSPGSQNWLIKYVTVANGRDYQSDADGHPLRFNAETLQGISDHWPMVTVLHDFSQDQR